MAITGKMACLVAAGSQVPAIGPTSPPFVFFRRMASSTAWSARARSFSSSSALSFSYDSVLITLHLAAGLGPKAQQSAFPDLLEDTGQIAGEHPFPPQDLPDGLIRTLGLKANLNILLGAEIPPLFLLAGHHRFDRGCFAAIRGFFSLLEPPEVAGPASVALRAPFAGAATSASVAY